MFTLLALSAAVAIAAPPSAPAGAFRMKSSK